jgi:hypothetical protein
MKLSLAGSFATILSVAALAGSARALDEIDELFSRDVPKGTAPQDAAAARGADDDSVSSIPLSGTPAYTDDARWISAPLTDSVVHQSAASATPQPSEPKSGGTSELSMVPEPSAVALAALALCYFLIFGRRYRWR